MADAGVAPIPLGNHEPAQLARFLREDFSTAWNAMATCSRDPRVGGNLMFARQALAYLELAARTASCHDDRFYLDWFAVRLAECDRRYFTALPGEVPLPRDFWLPATAQSPARRQLLGAVFDTARHGLAHLSQQIPVRLTDGMVWMLAFTGVSPGETFSEELAVARRDGHLAFRVSPNGWVYLIVRTDVLMADLIWASRLAAIFSKYLRPEYLQRPYGERTTLRASRAGNRQPDYSFSSGQLIAALEAGRHKRLGCPDAGIA